MQSHLTENTEEEEEETWLPWQREGNRDCTDWVASGEEGMERGARMGQKREEGEQAAEGARGHRGRLFSALPGDVTAMLT